MASSRALPIPELIRRGYDRAKGLGHDGPEALREAYKGILKKDMGELPVMEALEATHVVMDPGAMVAMHKEGSRDALRAWMAVLDGRAEAVISHPLLMDMVRAWQGVDASAREVALWVAVMTALPTWVPPGRFPGELEGHPGATACGVLEKCGGEGVVFVASSDLVAEVAASMGATVLRVTPSSEA